MQSPNFDVNKFNDFVKNEIVLPCIHAISSPPDIYRNTLDPFSAQIDCMIRGIFPEVWVNFEKERQRQKTLQGKIGYLHENVIDCFEGWEKLEQGKVIDCKNDKNMIIAEIKNKHNTTKGNHKKDIYDDLEHQIDTIYQGYQAYYVEILPKNKKRYSKCFTPSDNKLKTNRPSRDDIKIIDGKTFYGLVSGNDEFINKLYMEILPNSIILALQEAKKDNNSINLQILTDIYSDPYFITFYDKVFD
jgi:hypothetical protein